MEQISPSSRILEKYQGCLVGGAVGDALGAPVEFMSEKDIFIEHGLVTEMQGGGFFKWRTGEETDDTDLTLAITDSLIVNKGYDPKNIAQRFLDWFNNNPRDVGTTTASGLILLKKGLNWRDSGRVALEQLVSGTGNGSLMRTAPIALYFRGNFIEMDKAAAEVSAITHAHPDCIMATQIGTRLIAVLLDGASKVEAIDYLSQIYPKNTEAGNKLLRALNGDYSNGKSGYVFNTLGVALNAFLDSPSFEETIVKAVNLGGDTDTQAAVAGNIAGAYWGIGNIPLRWSNKLIPVTCEGIKGKAAKLFELNKIITPNGI